MKATQIKLIGFFLILFWATTVNAQSYFEEYQKEKPLPDLYLNSDEEGDFERSNWKNLSLNFGAMSLEYPSYDHYYFGLGYEIRRYDFMGIELNWKNGQLDLTDNSVTLWNEIEFEELGQRYFSSNFHTLSAGPKFYLYLVRDLDLYLFGAWDFGLYFLKAEGETIAADGTVSTSSKIFDPDFYNCIRVGAGIMLFKNLSVNVALAGDNVDFDQAVNALDWSLFTDAEPAKPGHFIHLDGKLIFYW